MIKESDARKSLFMADKINTYNNRMESLELAISLAIWTASLNIIFNMVFFLIHESKQSVALMVFNFIYCIFILLMAIYLKKKLRRKYEQ